jgi:hypothetical protein
MDFCHVPGADYAQDPYEMTPAITGHYYRFGRKTPSATWDNRYLNNVSYSNSLVWDMEKENPCPRGWRVATIAELMAMSTIELNPRTTLQTQNEEGYRGHTRGYIPFPSGGYRDVGIDGGAVGIIHSPNDSHTWAIDAHSVELGKNRWFERDGSPQSGGDYSKNYAEHVRCISEGNAYTGN